MGLADQISKIMPGNPFHPDAAFKSLFRRACLQKGLEPPADMQVRLHGHQCELFHRYASERMQAWVDNDRTEMNPDLFRHVERIIRNIATGEAAADVRKRVGNEGAPPTWMRLVHPFALRMTLNDCPDRKRGPQTWRQNVGGSARIVDFGLSSKGYGVEEFSRIMMKRRDDPEITEIVYTHLPEEGRTRRPVQIAIRETIPETTVPSVTGRRLSQIVEMEPTGHQDIDRAVESLVIESAQSNEVSVVFTLEPCRWIPWDIPPVEHMGWDDEAPHVE